MSKIGEMKEHANPETGEVTGFKIVTDIPEARKLTARPNARYTGEETSPKYELMQGARVMGKMWEKSELDINGNQVFNLMLDGYPLRWKVRMTGFYAEPGLFDLDYTAPTAKAEAAA